MLLSDNITTADGCNLTPCTAACLQWHMQKVSGEGVCDNLLSPSLNYTSLPLGLMHGLSQAHRAATHQPSVSSRCFQLGACACCISHRLVHTQHTKHHLCLNQPKIAVESVMMMKRQAKQAANKTDVDHQDAKLACIHWPKDELMPRSAQHNRQRGRKPKVQAASRQLSLHMTTPGLQGVTRCLL